MCAHTCCGMVRPDCSIKMGGILRDGQTPINANNMTELLAINH